MDLSQHFRRAQRLSPKAAQLASRLLFRSAYIAPDWQFALQTVLKERAQAAQPLSTTDLMALTDPEVPPPRRRVGSAPQDEATAFVEAVQRSWPAHPLDNAQR